MSEIEQSGPGPAEGASQIWAPRIARHLPFFSIVAEEEHFHRAAQRLNMTQSALSRRIQTLEQALNMPLFVRSQRSARLTPAGAALLRDVQHILGDMDTAVAHAQAVARGEMGALRLALNISALRSPLVADSIRDFRAHHPGVSVEVRSELTEQQITALRRDDIDAGFLYDLAIDDATDVALRTIPISTERFVLALPEAHPLAARGDLRIADLRHEPLTWPSRAGGRHLYDQMIAAFRKAGVSPHIATEVMSGEATLGIAAAGLGMGFVTESENLPGGVITRHVPDFDVRLDLHLVWRADSRRPALERYIEALKARLAAA
ncbi:LysR family transcriptional regulator [Sphingomonas sp. G-3-2-10]|uniref:LysR family transcriptional regulator n=1 Tax=Sphingomonas sp. G-3-2-10 TaxID=2728838 RepID=UPI00146E6B16|nr:LysR family transcriptional regulator [Sphingomonas sp. G-3-2-10]NML08434.1 LysR family transcriptional regulator [Sphingomonas sp. G-3-2-10]